MQKGSEPKPARVSHPRRVGTHLTRIQRHSAQVAGLPATEAAAAGSRRRTVLVLDVDPRTRARVEEILTLEGYRTSSTGDPRAALRMAREDRPDLLLTDIGMGVMDAVPRWERRKTDPAPPADPPPIVDGYALLRPLMLDPRAAAYPAVFIKTGDAAERAQPDRFGVVGYLAKPIARESLIERIEGVFHWLERSADWGGAAAQAADRALADTPPAPGFAALPKGLRSALVIDPDAESRRLVRRVLAPHGFTVHEAEDGEQGLTLALERRPWLIVTEVNMPRVDGFELCRRIRAHSITRHTPLIFFSAWDDYGERFLGLKLGADDYLAKGFPLRELLIRVQLVLKRYLDIGTRTRMGAGLEGRVELIGTPSMLQMCHIGRFSGVCTVRSEVRRTVVRFSEGQIVSAQSGSLNGAEAVFDLLAWTRGHFEFVPGPPSDEPPLPQSFDYLLLEGCRRLDEDAARGLRPLSAP